MWRLKIAFVLAAFLAFLYWDVTLLLGYMSTAAPAATTIPQHTDLQEAELIHTTTTSDTQSHTTSHHTNQRSVKMTQSPTVLTVLHAHTPSDDGPTLNKIYSGTAREKVEQSQPYRYVVENIDLAEYVIPTAGLLDQLYDLLCQMELEPSSAVISGQHTGAWFDEATRTVLRRKRARDGQPAFFTGAARGWVSFDLDGIDIQYLDPTSPAQSARNILTHLAGTYRLPGLDQLLVTSFVAQFSASTGVKLGTFGLHLWYILDTPRREEEWSQWVYFLRTSIQREELDHPYLKGTRHPLPLDSAYHNCVQLHYTASPSFINGAVDPINGPRTEISRLVEVMDTSFLNALPEVEQFRNHTLGEQIQLPDSIDDTLRELATFTPGTDTHAKFLIYVLKSVGRAYGKRTHRERDEYIELIRAAATAARPLEADSALLGAIKIVEGGWHSSDEKPPLHILRNTYTPQAATPYIDESWADEMKYARYKLVVLGGSTGTGKSRLIALDAARQRKRGRSVLFSSPYQSLAQAAAAKYNAEYYGNITGQIHPAHHPALSICNISYPRISAPYDCVYVDEVEGQQQLATHKKIARDVHQLYITRMALITSAKRVVIADANITEDTVQEYMRAMRITEDQVLRINHTYVTRTHVNFYDSPERLQHELGAALGANSTHGTVFRTPLHPSKRAFIACTSKRDAESIYTYLQKYAPHKSGLLYTSDTIAQVKHTLEDVNQSWMNVDYVVASPTISSGISVDVPDTFHVFMFGRRIPGMPAEALLQSLNRVRKPLSIQMYVSPVEVHAETATNLLRQHTAEIAKTDTLLGARGLRSIVLVVDGKLVAADYGHLRHLARLEAEVQRGASTIRRSLEEYYKNSPCTVGYINSDTDSDDRAVKSIRRRNRETGVELTQVRAESILAAPRISHEEALLVMRDNSTVTTVVARGITKNNSFLASEKERSALRALAFHKLAERPLPAGATLEEAAAVDEHNLNTINLYLSRGFNKRLPYIMNLAASSLTEHPEVLTQLLAEQDAVSARTTSTKNGLLVADAIHSSVTGRHTAHTHEVIMSLLRVVEERFNFSLRENVVKPILTGGHVDTDALPQFSAREVEADAELRTALEQIVLDGGNSLALKRLGLPRRVTKVNVYIGKVLHVLGVSRLRRRTRRGDGSQDNVHSIDVEAYAALSELIGAGARGLAERINSVAGNLTRTIRAQRSNEQGTSVASTMVNYAGRLFHAVRKAGISLSITDAAWFTPAPAVEAA